MKKPLLLFILFIFVLIATKMAYNRYCASKPEGCKKEKIDYEKDGLPQEGIDW